MVTYTDILAGLTPIFFLIALFSFAFCMLAIRAYKMKAAEFKALQNRPRITRIPEAHKNEIRTVKASISIPVGFKEDPEGVKRLEGEAAQKLAEVLFELDLVKFEIGEHGLRGEAFIVSTLKVVL